MTDSALERERRVRVTWQGCVDGVGLLATDVAEQPAWGDAKGRTLRLKNLTGPTALVRAFLAALGVPGGCPVTLTRADKAIVSSALAVPAAASAEIFVPAATEMTILPTFDLQLA